jgi:protein TonB
MFERIVDARSEKRGRARAVFFGVSTAAHAAGLGALLVWSFWTIERLEARTVPVTFVQALAPPPPPPPPAAPPAPAKVVAKRVVRDLVQPDRPPDDDPDPEPEAAPAGNGEPSDQPSGAGPGVPGGLPGGGPTCGVPGLPACEPPVVILDRPVTITADEAARISGEREIPLPPSVKQALAAEGRREVVALVKLCLDRDGFPSEVSIKRSTGYPEADARIAAGMWKWRYRPYRVNGNAVPVCTAITFRYQLL